MPEHASLQVTFAHRYRTARTKQDVAKRTAIFTQREFAIRPTIQIIEHRLRDAALCHRAQVFDIDDA